MNKMYRRVFRNKRVAIAGFYIFVLIVISIAAPYITPYKYDAVDFMQIYQPPSRAHILGTDELGRDILTRLVYGARVSLAVAVAGALTAFTIGVTWGTISGFAKGFVDNIMMRVVDFLYAFPTMLFVILLLVVFKGGVMQKEVSTFVRFVNEVDKAFGGLLFTMIGIGTVSWVGIARLSRGLVLSISTEQYVEAARAIGNSSFSIIRKHILPNLAGPCAVYVTIQIPGYILTEAFLSFVGLGVTPPTPSWGAMISEGCRVLLVYPHVAIFPGIMLSLTVLAFNFLGDGLRDVLDITMKL